MRLPTHLSSAASLSLVPRGSAANVENGGKRAKLLCLLLQCIDGLFDRNFWSKKWVPSSEDDSTLKTGVVGPGTESLLISRLGALNP